MVTMSTSGSSGSEDGTGDGTESSGGEGGGLRMEEWGRDVTRKIITGMLLPSHANDDVMCPPSWYETLRSMYYEINITGKSRNKRKNVSCTSSGQSTTLGD